MARKTMTPAKAIRKKRAGARAEKAAAKALTKKRASLPKGRAEGLDIPAEVKALDPLPPGLELPAHAAAEFFPMLEGKDADEFNADVRANGVNVAVTLIDIDGVRLVLDGRNRRRAAALACQACQAELYIGSDPVRFVMQRNLRRRHLTDGQKAFAAAEAEGFTHGGRRISDGAPPHSGKDGEVFGGKQPVAITREEAAAMTGASVRAVATAAKVRKKGSPELINAVRQGKIAPSAAVQALGLAPDDQKKVIAAISSGEAKTAKQVIKRGRVKERNAKLRAKVTANPTREYAVLLTDDEWNHETWSEQGQDRAAAMHYSTSPDAVLLQRQLAAAEHAVNYMWSTVPHQPLAFEVMKARGFTYRSQFAWWKIYPGNKPGLGYWSRIEHELLLIGTRGDIACPAPGDNWRSVQLSFVGEHSAKPEWSYRMIEAYHRGLVGTMIEYNARARRRGWSAWGNEIGLVEPPHDQSQAEFDELPVLADPDYIDLDRAMFTKLFGSAEDRAKMAANRSRAVTVTLAPADKPLSAKGVQAVEALAEAAAKRIAELPAEEMPENPDLRALWLIEAGRVGEVAPPDLKRVIVAGYATPGRANRKKGDSRPALISAHGAAELATWRQRVADEAAFDDAGGKVTHALERTSPKGGPFLGTCRLCGATDLPSSAALIECPNPRGLTSSEALVETVEGAQPLAGQGGPDGDGVPAFLKADSKERKDAVAKRDSLRGAADA